MIEPAPDDCRPNSLINQHYEIELNDLFGPDAHISDVEYYEDMIDFSIDARTDQDFIMPVNCQISGVRLGKIDCMITVKELHQHVSLKTTLRKASREFFKRLDENPQTGTQGGESPSTPA